jgi:phage shock protein A
MSETDADDTSVVDAELVPAVPEPSYTQAGVPTFDYVRDRIENRFTTAAAATELAGLGGEQDVASLDKKLAERDKAAQDKLAEIRRAMRSE